PLLRLLLAAGLARAPGLARSCLPARGRPRRLRFLTLGSAALSFHGPGHGTTCTRHRLVDLLARARCGELRFVAAADVAVPAVLSLLGHFARLRSPCTLRAAV